jgi:hypothetical protein
MKTAAKETLLSRVRSARDYGVADVVGAALERSALQEVKLARAKRSALIRAYRIRVSSLAEHGVSTAGAEESDSET